jgi:hypothetical protein
VGGGPTTSERAAVHADGSLSGFSIASSTNVPQSAPGASGLVAANFVYLIGGRNPIPGFNSSVALAGIQPDGSLSDFATMEGVVLKTPRWNHSSAVVGNTVYVVGGFDEVTNKALDSVESATILPDGSLTSFTVVAGLSLNTARYGHTAAVLGDSLWVFGGSSGSGFVDSAEQATIKADGSLSPFNVFKSALVPGVAYQSILALGGELFVTGGETLMGPVPLVLRTPISADGSLLQLPFNGAATHPLAGPHAHHRSFVIDNVVYNLGGDGQPTAINEKATLW